MAGRCSQWRKRVRNVPQGDLLKRLVDCNRVGRPSRMHDEDDGSCAAATGLAAIRFADGDDSFVVGVEGRAGMLFQFTHRFPSEVRCFWSEENHSHVPPRGNLKKQVGYVML